MFENPRRGRQARNFTTNVPKILDLKLSSEQIFSENWRWVPLIGKCTKMSYRSGLTSMTKTTKQITRRKFSFFYDTPWLFLCFIFRSWVSCTRSTASPATTRISSYQPRANSFWAFFSTILLTAGLGSSASNLAAVRIATFEPAVRFCWSGVTFDYTCTVIW